MIELFFLLYCSIDSSTKFCGGPLYGPEDRHRILQVREPGFTLKNHSF
jgi:hypothetical protein